MRFPYVVVGAGLAGLTIAERIATQLNEKVLIIEKRNHVGGNVYDEYNDDGILIQKYGPHTFHTNNKEVWDYLSQFTNWRDYQHRVLSYVDGRLVPFPLSLETINQLYNMNLSTDEAKVFVNSKKENIIDIMNSEDVVLANAGRDIYEKFFMNFTMKQWGVSPAQLDKSVISRIPFRYNCDTRYFTDKYQGQPSLGYTKMCQRMAIHPNVHLMLNTDYKEIIDQINYDRMIYTGPIDYFYDYCYGHLRYRSIRLQFETYDVESFQVGPSIRYPNDYDYTRITEFKKMTGQLHRKTTILKEYPCDGIEPFYPMPIDKADFLSDKYREVAQKEKLVLFIGRLAEYKYYDMDDVINNALSAFNKVLIK